jgi:hypothetical protein
VSSGILGTIGLNPTLVGPERICTRSVTFPWTDARICACCFPRPGNSLRDSAPQHFFQSLQWPEFSANCSKLAHLLARRLGELAREVLFSPPPSPDARRRMNNRSSVWRLRICMLPPAARERPRAEPAPALVNATHSHGRQLSELAGPYLFVRYECGCKREERQKTWTACYQSSAFPHTRTHTHTVPLRYIRPSRHSRHTRRNSAPGRRDLPGRDGRASFGEKCASDTRRRRAVLREPTVRNALVVANGGSVDGLIGPRLQPTE